MLSASRCICEVRIGKENNLWKRIILLWLFVWFLFFVYSIESHHYWKWATIGGFKSKTECFFKAINLWYNADLKHSSKQCQRLFCSLWFSVAQQNAISLNYVISRKMRSRIVYCPATLSISSFFSHLHPIMWYFPQFLLLPRVDNRYS